MLLTGPVPVKPLVPVIVIEDVPEEPAETVREVGIAERVKSGVDVDSETGRLFICWPQVLMQPLMSSLQCPFIHRV